jgi:hypothetical protein
MVLVFWSDHCSQKFFFGAQLQPADGDNISYFCQLWHQDPVVELSPAHPPECNIGSSTTKLCQSLWDTLMDGLMKPLSI